LRDAANNWGLGRLGAVNYNLLGSVGEESLDPPERRSSDSVKSELAEETLVGHFVESFREIVDNQSVLIYLGCWLVRVLE
jgi:hypothetical protein